jgi:hypothetical protein
MRPYRTFDRKIKRARRAGYGSLIKIISYWKLGAWRDLILQRWIETLRIREVTREDLQELSRLGVVRIRTTKHVNLDIKEVLKNDIGR